MSRPVDCVHATPNVACMPFSPRDVLYSGWVGDDDSTWAGLKGALSKIIYRYDYVMERKKEGKRARGEERKMGEKFLYLCTSIDTVVIK